MQIGAHAKYTRPFINNKLCNMLTYNEDKDLRRVKASVEIDKSQFRNCGGYKKAK